MPSFATYHLLASSRKENLGTLVFLQLTLVWLVVGVVLRMLQAPPPLPTEKLLSFLLFLLSGSFFSPSDLKFHDDVPWPGPVFIFWFGYLEGCRIFSIGKFYLIASPYFLCSNSEVSISQILNPFDGLLSLYFSSTSGKGFL